MNEKKYILLIDIKEFTYKNSLLTNAQVEEILNTFEDIIREYATSYELEIVKSIGDAYLVLSNTYEGALWFSQDILKASQKYDAKQSIELKHIALRVSITYGDIRRKKSLDINDYFGDMINICSRINAITPKWMIYVDSEVIPKGQKWEYSFVGTFSFHWVITEREIYAYGKDIISTQSIEKISHENYENCDKIVFTSSCVAAVFSVSPIPFIESFNIIAVHLYMIVKISVELGEGVSLRKASKIFLQIAGTLGVSYVALLWANTAVKILLPWIGGYLFAPVSFAVTYALWKIYTAYFIYATYGISMDEAHMYEIFQKQKNAGKTIAKLQKKEIFATGKKFYKDILSIKKKSGYTQIQNDIVSMLRWKKSVK